jgi:hypothetical protein
MCTVSKNGRSRSSMASRDDGVASGENSFSAPESLMKVFGSGARRCRALM